MAPVSRHILLLFLIQAVVSQEDTIPTDESTSKDELITTTELVPTDSSSTTTTDNISTDPPSISTTEPVPTDPPSTSTTEPEPTPTEAPQISLGEQKTYTWDTSGGYPTDNESLHVWLSDEYDKGIIVTINYIDVDGANKDFILIKSGESLDDDDEDSEGNIFTYKVEGPKRLYFDTRDVFAYFRKASNVTTADSFKGFSIIFERAYDLGTSTTSTTTEIPWPTPDGGKSSDFTVNVSGLPYELFADSSTLKEFKNAIANMAIIYCSDNNFYLKETVTNENVLIKKIVRCPYVWPGSENCAQITFAVPVLLDETVPQKYAGYQLTTQHLERMWATLAKSFLPSDITIYIEPDTNDIALWWGIAISTTTIIFIIFLWLMRVICTKTSALTRRRKLSDTGSIIESDGDSVISLGPHYYQDTPPIFEKAFPLYKP